MSLNGTDISGYQPGSPNLSGDAFSIVKATEGVGFQNGNWAAQVDWCREHGAMVGHYHFANGLNTPAAEADYFWSVVSTKWQTGEPVAVDIEGAFFSNTADPVGWTLAFCQELYARSGLKALIYIDWAHEKAAAYNWQPLVDYNTGLWGAAYNSTGFGDPSPWPFVVIWQYADSNASGGDSDTLYGDANTFHAYGTPTGGNPVILTQDDANLVAETLLNWNLNREGGPQGQLNLAAFLQWSDANFIAIQNLVKAVNLTITDAQVTELANLLIAKLPPAQISALAAQLQK